MSTTFADHLANVGAESSGFGLTRKYYDPTEVNFTPGQREFVAWISTETIDHESDVVVASGVDFKSVFLGETPEKGNPVVLACHEQGTWPIGVCEWVKVRKVPEWVGLYSKTKIDDDPDALLVWKKIQNRTVRGISIGFIPPEGASKSLWGPPTSEEIRRNPHWKGAARIIRKCVLIEYSVVPIGMNPSALITAVSKGMHKPEYKETSMDDEHEAEVIPEASEPETKDALDLDTEEKAVTSHMPEEDNDDDEVDEPEEDLPIRKGHSVRVVKGTYKGIVGKVKSIHRGEMVPDVDDDVMGTKHGPGCRLKVYKAMRDGHMPTENHIGVHMKNLTRIDDLRPPSKPQKQVRTGGNPLPPLVMKTDEQVAAERVAAYRAALTPDVIRQVVQDVRDQFTGKI